MTMILRPSSKRRLAATMLFVWIFALLAGVANACALGEAHGGFATQASSARQHDEAMDGHSHADAPLHKAEPSSDTPPPACQKFCDDERSTLNVPLKALGGTADMLPLLLLQPTALAWTSGDDPDVDAPDTLLPARETGPPISIRFLRLTI